MLPSLESMLDATRASLPGLRARRAEVEGAAQAAPRPPGLAAALRKPTSVSLIAEVKRRSPSAGEISATLDPVAHAVAYVGAGAVAISVLTDGPHFGGSLADLTAVARQVTVPILRKDFILDEVQVAEAKAAGASAVLLIVRALAQSRLRELLACARGWGLEALVEVHEESELEIAMESEARVIGVNSRNLDDLTVDVAGAWELLSRIPVDRLAVAESGMQSVTDVERAAAAGADAVLIGSALSGSATPGESVSRLIAVPRRGR